MSVCEACGCSFKRTLPCSSYEQPVLRFCANDYLTHVRDAHDGEPLPGSPSLDEAINLCMEQEEVD